MKTNNITKYILVICTSLAAVILSLFIRQDQFDKILDSVEPDNISVIYLELMSMMQPGNSDITLSLARQHEKMGELEKASAVLKNLQAESIPDVQLLLIEIELKRYFKREADDLGRGKILDSIKSDLTRIDLTELTEGQLEEFVQLSLAIGKPDVAAVAYIQWSRKNTERSKELQLEGARWFIAAGEPGKAAAVYEKAYRESDSAEKAHEGALLYIKALREAGDDTAAFAFTREYLGTYPDDAALLKEAISLALATENPAMALYYGKILGSQKSRDLALTAKVLEWSLAAGDLPEALIQSKKMLDLNPEDVQTRKMFAQISEWNGEYDQALTQWLWLASGERAKVESIEHALRLSLEREEFLSAIEMTIRLSEHRELTASELNNIVYFYSKSSASGLVDFFRTYTRRYPARRDNWEQLARLEEEKGLLSDAEETWAEIELLFDVSLYSATQRARILNMQGHTVSAYNMLSVMSELASEKDDYFWRELGELGWNLGLKDEAYTAYQNLYVHGEIHSLAVERLISLSRSTGKYAAAVSLGLERYEQSNEPRWLLLAMDSALEAKNFSRLEELMQIAEGDDRMQTIEMYWFLIAQLSTQQQRTDKAVSSYLKVISINPNSSIAREGVLWALIDANKKDSVRQFLVRWKNYAFMNPSLWMVYGVAYSRLGEHDQALTWFNKKFESNSQQYAWLPAYYNTLVAAGEVDAAQQLGNYIVARISKDVSALKEGGSKEALSLSAENLRLIRELKGAEYEHALLVQLDGVVGRAALIEFIVTSELAAGTYEAARHWLMLAQKVNYQTMAWQRMAIALHDDDRQRIVSILNDEHASISALQKSEALARIGRPGEALESLDLALAGNYGSAFEATLISSKIRLVEQQKRQVNANIQTSGLGFLEINQVGFQLGSSFKKGSLGLDVKRMLLSAPESDLAIGNVLERDFSISANIPLYQNDVDLFFGSNLNKFSSITYGGLKLCRDVVRDLKVMFRLGIHEISTETAALRAIGMKSKVSMALSYKPLTHSFTQLLIDGHQYLTRAGRNLGTGNRVEFQVGHILLDSTPMWNIRLQGSWESNNLKSLLPQEISDLLPDDADIGTIVSPEYGQLGLGTSYRYGSREFGERRSIYFTLDAITGWAWPSNVPYYNVSGGVGLSFLGIDALSLDGFYGNVQGGRADEVYSGLMLNYSYAF
jgi:tetratricopeptide (TPR) repeat protein